METRMSQEYVSVKGGCYCGAVRYEADVDLYGAYYCHCKICQKTSGAPAEVGVLVKPGTLEFTNNEPKFFQTSPFGRRGFCAECGSRIIWMSPGKGEWTNVSVGSLDNPERVIPKEHTCVESKLPWYKLVDELPRTRSEDESDLVAAWAEAGMSTDGTPL
jgi:adenylate cyclase